MKNSKWGFLRETAEIAKKAGIDKDTGLHRNGLDEYLKVIFPEITDWVHDKVLPKEFTNGKSCRKRPDYRSETLKLIVEFDGLQHYTQPDRIKKDESNTKFYKSCGYKVIRIPYFIQLTNECVKCLFGRDVKEKLFDDKIPSIGIEGKNTPAYLCPAGIERMKKEFKKFPKQYQVNKNFLKKQNDEYLTGLNLI